MNLNELSLRVGTTVGTLQGTIEIGKHVFLYWASCISPFSATYSQAASELELAGMPVPTENYADYIRKDEVTEKEIEDIKKIFGIDLSKYYNVALSYDPDTKEYSHILVHVDSNPSTPVLLYIFNEKYPNLLSNPMTVEELKSGNN